MTLGPTQYLLIPRKQYIGLGLPKDPPTVRRMPAAEDLTKCQYDDEPPTERRIKT
jgi:hypothetical protein